LYIAGENDEHRLTVAGGPLGASTSPVSFGSRSETREGQRWCVGSPPMSSRRKRGWAHHRPEAVVLDLVNPEISTAFLFSALRFLVAVSSDFSGCSCVLKVLFSNTSRRR
jgi:hypothetical protein